MIYAEYATEIVTGAKFIGAGLAMGFGAMGAGLEPLGQQLLP